MIYSDFFNTFKNYQNDYVVIGGNAASILIGNQGGDFRQTQDYDIVILFENIQDDFSKVFFDYISNYEYDFCSGVNKDQHQYYRFTNPKDNSAPKMIEMFSRIPLDYSLKEHNHKTPLHFEDGPSLSAIVLDDNYYSLLKLGKQVLTIDGVDIPTLKIPYLILLKAKAHLDMASRDHVSHHADKTKHRNDIFRLIPYMDLSEYNISEIPIAVLTDLKKFIETLSEENSLTDNQLKSLKINTIIDVETILDTLKKMAGLM
ncbi:hypothetical protein OIS37_16095 [Lactiplantibacillus plantarum]|uniref:hypothetical protein n=1 Tax=Lactiplantibacillus plantarum TaxID=1590 RepID=UPI0021F6B487|nr:hypothetical protein [Lactiplantibacillus plantarum]MCW0154647.1 hypothetical protein [Lactiplantibacillus plantarum]